MGRPARGERNLGRAVPSELGNGFVSSQSSDGGRRLRTCLGLRGVLAPRSVVSDSVSTRPLRRDTSVTQDYEN